MFDWRLGVTALIELHPFYARKRGCVKRKVTCTLTVARAQRGSCLYFFDAAMRRNLQIGIKLLYMYT